MKKAARWMKTVLIIAVTLAGLAIRAQAADLPLAAASPMTGVAFDDRPLLLPIQRNFQMAMLTAGSELGRSCGKMEAYGWRMSQSEQGRVNQIFNNTVDRLRLLGYNISPQTLTSVSKDITLYTADRRDKHFMFLWSAGELGLVLNLCETSAPIAGAYHPAPVSPSVQVFPVPMDVTSARLDSGKGMARSEAAFTPLGQWQGGYTCAQGYTGGTLKINHTQGRNFDGVFSFYPTPKNPTVPAGSYNVYGQYDSESKRILINPGTWIKRPANFYNTVIVGIFDPAKETFSAYFQGISGCTSFEATHTQIPAIEHAAKKVLKKKPVKKQKVAKAKSKGRILPADLVAAPLPAVVPDLPTAGLAPAALPSLTPPTVQALPATPAAPAQAAPLPEEDKATGGILLVAPSKKAN